MASVSKRSWLGPKGEPKFAWRVDWSDHGGKRHRQQFPTKGAADAFRIEMENQLRQGVFRADARTMLVAGAADAWLAHCQRRYERGERMTRGMLVYYRSYVENYILAGSPGRLPRPANKKRIEFAEGVGHLKLAHLTPRAVNAFVDRLRACGLTVHSTRQVVRTLHTMLAFAMREDLVGTNAAHGVRVIGRRDEGVKKVVVPAKATVRALLTVASEPMKVRILFAATTGARAGEMHALRFRHLDLDVGLVRFETRVDKFGEEDGQGTKSAAGNREVPLAAGMVELLRRWKLAARSSQEDDLVFPNRRGGYEEHDNMRKRKFTPLFAAIKGDLGIDHVQFHWHALRHYAISTWIEAGLSPKAVQTFAGHSALQVTMDRYGHLFPSTNHTSAMNEVAQILTDGLAV